MCVLLPNLLGGAATSEPDNLSPFPPVVSLCCLWYFSSALSSNTGKSIFMVFKFPVTLTLIQFAIISFYCFVYTRPALKLGTLREPTKALLRGVLPMAAFQVGGHVFSSVATSRVPVATVHTIKVRRTPDLPEVPLKALTTRTSLYRLSPRSSPFSRIDSCLGCRTRPRRTSRSSP